MESVRKVIQHENTKDNFSRDVIFDEKALWN